MFVCLCRGRTYYEKLLAEHPKRTDIWLLYIEQEICLLRRASKTEKDNIVYSTQLELLRLLFSRAAALPLKPHKMKSIFSKWLSFEKQYGSINSQQEVQQKAAEYVSRVEHQLLNKANAS